MTLRGLALVALGGMLGSLGRALLGALVTRLCGPSFPFATSTVNVLGCFLFGCVWVFLDKHWAGALELKLLLLTGFLGAFTTFSTYLFETHVLIQEARLLAAGLNLFLQNALGLLALYGGVWFARTL